VQRGGAGRPGRHRRVHGEAQAGLEELTPRPDAIAPDGSEVYFRELGSKRASLVEVALRPGGVSRPVRHRTVEEIWYFLGGEGEVWVDGAVKGVRAGSTVIIRTGAEFQFRTLGDETLRFLCYTSPPWPGDDEAIAANEGGLGQPTV
jgi:mannose-6-phosphate isomerase-like protein (cupin superfamily)